MPPNTCCDVSGYNSIPVISDGEHSDAEQQQAGIFANIVIDHRVRDAARWHRIFALSHAVSHGHRRIHGGRAPLATSVIRGAFREIPRLPTQIARDMTPSKMAEIAESIK